MKEIKFDNNKFDTSLYDTKIIYCITCNKYWDGGYKPDANLSEKSEFYNIANQFSNIVKSLVSTLNDVLIIGDKISETGSMFQHWKDLKEYDAFNNLSDYIKKKHYYSLSLPHDNNIIDYLIENNFRYLTSIDFYLQKNKIIIQPTCHTEIFIYSKNYDKLIPIIEKIIENYPEISLKQYKNNWNENNI